MATHSGILAWEIAWTEELGGLQSTGSQRLRHDLATKQQHDSYVTLNQLGPLRPCSKPCSDHSGIAVWTHYSPLLRLDL